MALNALTLAVTKGIVGQPFISAVNGITYPNRVEVLNDGAPGFGYVNGTVRSASLPYPVSTVVLREWEPGVGAGFRDSRIDITAATDAALRAAYVGGSTPAPTLGTPTLSGSLTQGAAASGVTLNGLTDGSAVAFNISGLSVGTSGTSRAVSGTPASSGALNVTETLAGATNSPRVTNGVVTVAASGFVFPAISTAKKNSDSRMAGTGSRSVQSGNSTISVRYGCGGVQMGGLFQSYLGNPYLLTEGFQHAIGASSSLAQYYRDQSTSIASTGNPAAGIIGTGAAANDALYSTGSDGVTTCLTQGGNHIFSSSIGVNDTATYYNSPSPAYQSIRTIAQIADAYGTAGKVWYVGNEFPRGDQCIMSEVQTVTGGTCTASLTTNFVDGETFGAVGVTGVFASGLARPLTKVASAPAQDQYTVSALGVYVFGGTAPTSAYLTYNASPAGGRAATSTAQKVINEWMNSNASNFVSSVNSVDYGIPGLQYQRPWVRVFDSWNALLDTSSGATALPKAGTYAYDNTQLHGNFVADLLTAKALKTKFQADYPSAQPNDTRPTRNNWYAARGTGSGTTFNGTLPPSMRAAATGGTNAPTLIAINGAVIGKVDTTTGAITGTGITSGSLNYSTGEWTITFTAASSMPANAQLWFEQDIGNFDYVNLTEGTIGRNTVMNGLLDMTAAVGTNLTTTTGTTTLNNGITGAQVPYGWALPASTATTNINNALTAGTMVVTVASETDSAGFPRFAMEAYGSAAAATLVGISQTLISTSVRVGSNAQIVTGANVRYAKTAANGRTYGHAGMNLATSTGTGGVNRTFSTGTFSVTQANQQMSDGVTVGSPLPFLIDDQALNIEGGSLEMYRVTPMLDTTGFTGFAGGAVSISCGTLANVPFAFRMGVGRVQMRRRNDLAFA